MPGQARTRQQLLDAALIQEALGQANAAERGELLALLHRVYDLPDAGASVAAG